MTLKSTAKSHRVRYKPDLMTTKRLLESLCLDKEKLQKIWDTVLLEMLIMYYPPIMADEKELNQQSAIIANAYIEALSHIPHDALRQGWRDVVKENTTYRWPTVGKIVEACQVHQTRIQPESISEPWKRDLLEHLEIAKFRSWLQKAHLKITGENAVLQFDKDLNRRWCQTNYGDLLLLIIRKHYPMVRELDFDIKKA